MMKTVTIKDIYGTDEPVIPEGYEAVTFPIPTGMGNYIFVYQ
jgi:hypothetical protein